jgi:very-short-patch-repair endonuclease
MEGKAHELESLIAGFAARQRGNVTRGQLLAHGASPTMIDRRLRVGALRRKFRGVYFAGHGPEPPLAHESAAVLACAPQALLGARTAAVLRDLPVVAESDVDVIVVGRQIRGQSGIRVRMIGSLGSGELRRMHGVPIASPALILLDLAGTLGEAELAQALNEARVQRMVRDHELAAVIAAHPKRRGARALAKLLAAETAELATGSEAEALCLTIMRKHGLEPDEAQARIGRYRVDFLFRAERLVVEVDGYRYHGTRHRFVRDRRRTAAIVAKGYVIFPVSWHDLVDASAVTMRALADALAVRRSGLATRS